MSDVLRVKVLCKIIPNKEERLKEVRNKSELLLSLTRKNKEEAEILELFEKINEAIDNMAEIAQDIEDKEFVESSLMPYIDEVDSLLDIKIKKYKELLAAERDRAISALRQRSELISKDLENNKQIKASEVAIENSINVNNLLKEVLEELKEEDSANQATSKK